MTSMTDNGYYRSNIAIAVVEFDDGSRQVIYSVAGKVKKQARFDQAISEFLGMPVEEVPVADYLTLDEFNTSISRITGRGAEDVSARQVMEEAYEKFGGELGREERYFDTEPKLLEHIARQTSESNGQIILRVELYTERHPCLSCGGGRIIDGHVEKQGNAGVIQHYWLYFQENNIDMSVYYMTDDNIIYNFNN